MRSLRSGKESDTSTQAGDVYKRVIDTLTLIVIVTGLYFAWDQAKQFDASQNLSNWSDVSARTF